MNRTLNRNGLLDYASVPQNIRDDNKIKRANKINWIKVIFSDESDGFPDQNGKLHYQKRKGEPLI